MRLKGKSAIVTAAGQGIGRATAERFRAEGAYVWALDRDATALASLTDMEHVKIDLTDPTEIEALPGLIGPVDILANVAGYVAAGDILQCTQREWRLSFDLNVDAMFHLSRAFLPAMVERGSGSIINMSSIASSLKGIPNRFAYGASKGAVIGLTRAIAADFVGRGVRCNCICPGTVETPSLHKRIEEQADEMGVAIEQTTATFVARQPMGRLGKAEEIAALFAYLASDEAAFTTGAVHVIDGGWIN